MFIYLFFSVRVFGQLYGITQWSNFIIQFVTWHRYNIIEHKWNIYDLIDLYQFHKLTLGYGNTTASESLLALLAALRDKGANYPGEGEPVVSLLSKMVNYLNDTASWQDLLNSTNFFYSVVNSLLEHRNFIINHQVDISYLFYVERITFYLYYQQYVRYIIVLKEILSAKFKLSWSAGYTGIHS